MKRLLFLVMTFTFSFALFSCGVDLTETTVSSSSTSTTTSNETISTTSLTSTLPPTTNIIAFFDLSEVTYLMPSTSFLLHSMISDNVVFQQGKDIRIFGQAEAGTIILAKLTLDSSPTSTWLNYTIVPESGEWVIILPALESSFDTYTLTVSDTVHETSISNCLIGEVWLISGQSNMEMKVSEMDLGYDLFGSINEEYIRVFDQTRLDNNASFSYLPRYDVRNGIWKVSSSYGQISNCSGIGFSFAYKLFYMFLQQGKQVPVAIINTPIGGTKIQSWLPREEVVQSSVLRTYVESNGYSVDENGWNTLGWNNNNQVSANFNEKIAPLTNFNIQGVAWYQGESDPVFNENIVAIEALIDSWSRYFNQNDDLLYFAMIEIAPYDGSDPLTTPSTNWYLGFANQRRAQYEIAKNPKYQEHLILVPIYDIDLKWDVPTTQFLWKDPIHPVIKLPVGQRLAKMLMSFVYLKDDQYIAPMVESVTKLQDSIIVSFSHVGDGLILFKNTSSGVTTIELIYFNGIKLSANARIISENQIEITEINPTLVKYVSYSNLSRNETSNLSNSYLIPAIPFVYDTEE